jgi:cyanate lyase
MSELVKNARKYNTWQLLHNMTGWSKDYCKKVVNGKREHNSEAAKEILDAFNQLEKQLLNQ